MERRPRGGPSSVPGTPPAEISRGNARGRLLALGAFELFDQRVLRPTSDHLVRHAEKNSILLRDVRAKERHVVERAPRDLVTGARVAGRQPLGPRAHRGVQLPTLLVLLEHDPDRAPVAWKSGRFQGGEENSLLLLVVASVGEALHEVGRAKKEGGIDRVAGAEPLRRRLERGQHALDDAVFLHEDGGGAQGAHAPPSLVKNPESLADSGMSSDGLRPIEASVRSK